jgi:hypothetical protein
MDILSILATVILFTTVGTLMVALAAYAAYKLREKRKPSRKKRNKEIDDLEPIFLKLYDPQENLAKKNMGTVPES